MTLKEYVLLPKQKRPRVGYLGELVKNVTKDVGKETYIIELGSYSLTNQPHDTWLDVLPTITP